LINKIKGKTGLKRFSFLKRCWAKENNVTNKKNGT